MNEPFLMRAEAEVAEVRSPARVVLDPRRPQLLDHREHVLQVVSGHVDLFAVEIEDGAARGARSHLFRVDSGEIIPSMLTGDARTGRHVVIIAVGSPGTAALMVPRAEIANLDPVLAWIARLAKVIAGPHPSWQIREADNDGVCEMAAEECRRGPARTIVWGSVTAGEARLMGVEPAYGGDGPPIPLTSGMWLQAQDGPCQLVGSTRVPGAGDLWRALDQFHLCAVTCLRAALLGEAGRDAERLVRRNELSRAQSFELIERLSAVIVRPSDRPVVRADVTDSLFAACAMVAEALLAPITRPPGRAAQGREFDDLIEIARASRLRVRRTLLRGDWWEDDVGPLVGWYGEERAPVALMRGSRKRYVMVEPSTGTRRLVDEAIAMRLAPEAATFYPALPARALGFRDLFTFSLRHSKDNVARIVLAAVTLGLLSLVSPLITQVLVDSVIPRTELDLLVFCAIALAVTAIATAGMQTMEGVAMLRLEGLIDWKLQSAVIDRLLRLPASLFREYTVGDFVDRSLGIDSVRRIFTGRTLRSLLSGLFCWFSILLMVYYDAKLALVAVALTIVRGLLIIATSAIRLYHENRHFDLQGKVGGFVLQLLTGIGKLRVAAATIRALAVWSKQFATQKHHFIASQRAANTLAVVETAFPTVATLIIFAAAMGLGSSLTSDLGAFLAFFTAFGQSLASVGAWATGISESLIALPYLRRLRPLIAGAAEVSEDRKPPGELSGGVELSRVTFRYVAGGPPVLDNVTLRIPPGEYVAIVGPSGSGKSSLFRLLLGFERPESGAVFYDGKAIDTLDTSAVRRQLGVVLQNGKLATGSIYQNICGGLQLPLEQAWEAAQLAGLDADIKAMPMGMHTVISEGVNTLSGGQRQRVMIARAVARRPRILLLDEATSSLDNQSQAIVSTSLGALNVTRIVIAHRLSTVRQADRIVVLVEGKVVQTGSFAELSNASGMFADFARRQLMSG